MFRLRLASFFLDNSSTSLSYRFEYSYELSAEFYTEMLSEFKSVCDDHDISVFLLYGTALGAYRDGKSIPGDNDADLGIPMSQRHHVKAALPAFKSRGFELVRICPYNLVYTFKWKDGFVDIYPVSKPPLFYRLFGKKWHCEAALFSSDYFNLNTPESISFAGKSFLLPNPPEGYLAELYGKDWRIPQSVHASYRPFLSRLWRFFFIPRRHTIPAKFSASFW